MFVAAIVGVVTAVLSVMYVWWVRGSDNMSGQYTGSGKQPTEARTIEQREADTKEALQ